MNKLEIFADFFWVQVIQVSLLFLVVLVAAFFLARKRPHFVYLLWVIFFIKCITPPVLQSPISAFSWMQPANQSLAQLDSTHKKAIVPYKFAERQIPAVRLPKLPAPTSAKSLEVVTTKPNTTKPNKPLQTPSSNSQTIETVTPKVPPAQTTEIQWDHLLLVTWASGSLALFIFLVVQWVLFFAKVRRGRESTPDWLLSQTRDLSRKLGLRKKVRTVVTNASVGPFVIGWLRPQIVLPTHMLAEEFRKNLTPILAHELCHVRRGDPLISLVQCFAQVVFWFHPLVWWANKHANRLCELCCDEEAIESLKIRKLEYAQSLLAVIDTKRQLRPVWAASGMSLAENTKQRLREIMRSKQRIEKTPLWCQLVAAAVLLTVLPSNGYNSLLHAQDEENTVQNIRQALAQGDFEQAEEMCRERIEEDDQDAMAIHLLGYTLHGAGDLEQAIKYHKQATKFDSTRALGYYNWACVHALKNEPDQAIAKLEKSLKAGLQLQVPITSDSDFESMYDNPAFKKIAAKLAGQGNSNAGRPATGPSVDLNSGAMKPVMFWVGNWEVVNEEGIIVGHNEISMQESGNLIHEKWTSASGSTGQSINYFDPETQMLKQTWVDSKGQVLELSGEVSDGKMTMNGAGTIEGERVQCKMSLKKLQDGRIKQVVKTSKDEGENWELYFEGFYQQNGKSGAR